MKEKLAIIGRGTGGCFAITHFLKWTDWEIDWYFDPAILPQAVGEGSNLIMPNALFTNMNFTYDKLISIDGSIKLGLEKTGWGDGHKYHEYFSPPSVGYHFNAVKLQDYIIDFAKQSNRIKFIPLNISNKEIDADYIMDCSGKPTDLSDYNTTLIPVNAVHVTQCYWDAMKFNHTLTLARPYGWVFGIPLQNRCSIGYLYNSNINSLDEVKEDVKNIFKEYNLTPSEDTNSFKFNSYYKKENYSERVIYNGNASFFLEPLEATSFGFMDFIQRRAFTFWKKHKNETAEQLNQIYIDQAKQIETVIMMHYFAGSQFDTKFWEYAKQQGQISMESMKDHALFKEMVIESQPNLNNFIIRSDFGQWPISLFKLNIANLNIYDRLKEILEK